MQIVIDISEEIYKNINNHSGMAYAVEDYLHEVEWAIKDGTPLPKGQWLRMSDLSEEDDDRYKCSRCGNVIHHKSMMNLYTFDSWCGRCGSDNSRHQTVIEADKGSEG